MEIVKLSLQKINLFIKNFQGNVECMGRPAGATGSAAADCQVALPQHLT
jgi:hypothetical protein